MRVVAEGLEMARPLDRAVRALEVMDRIRRQVIRRLTRPSILISKRRRRLREEDGAALGLEVVACQDLRGQGLELGWDSEVPWVSGSGEQLRHLRTPREESITDDRLHLLLPRRLPLLEHQRGLEERRDDRQK